jgi:hypothetical protein
MAASSLCFAAANAINSFSIISFCWRISSLTDSELAALEVSSCEIYRLLLDSEIFFALLLSTFLRTSLSDKCVRRWSTFEKYLPVSLGQAPA